MRGNGQEMNMATRVQILDQAVCISHSTDSLEKGMHPTILYPAINKSKSRVGSLTLVLQLVQ